MRTFGRPVLSEFNYDPHAQTGRVGSIWIKQTRREALNGSVAQEQDMLHKTAQERYDKLKKEFIQLMARFNRDDLDNFVQTANSLREWITHDSALNHEQKAALQRFVVDESLDWQICNQIANHQKHRRSKPRSKARRATASVPTVKSVDMKPGGTGFSVPPSMRVVGAGDEIMIEIEGNRESALAFVIRTFQHFYYIFEVAAIPPCGHVLPTVIELLAAESL
jgi:hypothetical protein